MKPTSLEMIQLVTHGYTTFACRNRQPRDIDDLNLALADTDQALGLKCAGNRRHCAAYRP
jgi:hypothetical protein